MTDITKPRRYVLAGDEPSPSVALAVLGDMLERAEAVERELGNAAPVTVAIQRSIVGTLRVARERVASAEASR